MNGIAYSGDEFECGTIVDKINNSIINDINPIQIRAKDIQSFIFVDGKIDNNKINELINLLNNYIENGKRTVSVHLPNPVWENGDIAQKNYVIGNIIHDILVPLGITEYTIHPHINLYEFNSMTDNEKTSTIDKMGKYFAFLASNGANLAIENIPVRNINEIDSIVDEQKRKKAKKNISFGMSIEEIDIILNATRAILIQSGISEEKAKEMVGITYDTGHSLAQTSEEHLESTVESWINHFANDIKIFHITPSVYKEKKIIHEKKTAKIITLVNKLSSDYHIEALPLIEAHGSIELMTDLYEFGNRDSYSIDGEEIFRISKHQYFR